MAAVAGNKTAHATLSTTTADTVTLANAVQFVRVSNHHASVVLYVTVSSGRTAANAAAGVTTAVAQADETISVSPGATKEVFASPGRGAYVALSVVGNANSYSVEGSDSRLQA